MKKLETANDTNYRKFGQQDLGLSRAILLFGRGAKLDPLLGPLSFIPGSFYHKLNRFLNPFHEKIPGANIRTSIHEFRQKME